MSAQHTPGPLSVIKTDYHEDRQADIKSDYHNKNGDFNDRYVAFGGYFGSYGPHIFAAAPELLAALEELRDAHWLNLPLRAGEIIQAAIAKAKGGAES